MRQVVGDCDDCLVHRALQLPLRVADDLIVAAPVLCMASARAHSGRLPRRHLLRLGCFFTALVGVALYGAVMSVAGGASGSAGDGGAVARRRLSAALPNMSGAIKPDTCEANCDPLLGVLEVGVIDFAGCSCVHMVGIK